MKKFKIYAKRGRDARFFLVYVFRTRAQMYWHRERLRRRMAINPLSNDWEASATVFGYAEGLLCFGFLMFHVESITARIVSHEITHAAIYWFNGTVNGFDWEDIPKLKAAEEELCYVQGDLIREFYINWWSRCEKWSQLNHPQ